MNARAWRQPPQVGRFSYREVLPWVGLAAILLGYIVLIAQLRPINLFGAAHDDSIYFSSAKALAEGKGYVLPSLPGEPPAANKYPILYSWMLSWVWRWNPSFPANVNDGVALTAAFGLAYIIFAFGFFRRSMKLSDVEALFLTAFCAFQPTVLFHGATILSDLPFAALALGAMMLADKTIEPNGTLGEVVACGGLTGLSILMRTTGYPILMGIVAIAILRRAWRQAIIFSSMAATFLAFLEWEKLSTATAVLPAGWYTFGAGFRQTWLYYTDYVGFRKLSIVNLHVVGTIVLNQVLYLCAQVPGYFLSPLFSRSVPLLFVLTVGVLWAIVAGFIRTIKLNGWKPIHAALPCYVALFLAWNYPGWDRFLLPFLPLIVASLWIEGKWVAGELSRLAQIGCSRGTRAAAFSAAFALAALTMGMVWNFLTNRDRADYFNLSRDRGELLVEKRQAYDWLRLNAPDDARIIAGEDVCVYLYTARKSMGAIAMLPIGGYEQEQLHWDLNHMTDVADAIGATYWLGSPDDVDKQGRSRKPQLTARLNEIEGVLPELFQSASGSVRIYGLGCLQNRQDTSCRSTDPVLFPKGQ